MSLPGGLSSLRARLVALILAALAVAQLVSLYFFVDEREMAVRTAIGLEAAARAANIARLIEDAPADLHAAILRSATSPLVRFRMQDAPSVDHRDHGAGGAIERRIRAILDGPAERDIRVELHRRSGLSDPVRPLPPEMRPMHRAMLESHTEPVEMLLSIGLADGRWLNARTMFHRPPLQWAWSTVLTFLVSAALIVAVVWVALGRIIGPLTALAGAADRLGRGERVAEIAPTGPAELRRLTEAFNRMQARLTRFLGERTRLLAALGHDLRSPLTAMRVRLELLDDDENKARLTAMVDEMQTMVEATLGFARGMAVGEASETLDLAGLARDLAAEAGTPDAPVRVIEAMPAPARIRPGSFRRALRNVIENAVRYGGGAEIAVRPGDGDVAITVHDRGPGIPEDDLDNVFEPFVRLETSRSRETGGVGLGLAIARTILHAHGGEISLANRSDGGLCVTLTLPAAPAETLEGETT
ncbi:ATP-binding protein [Rhodovulum sp. YNF3179]|uniref:ATP-binding protein n=1 Tax=Rhodovulum sp. YNF3179 TaxID=3425127 RepID=UPI003D349E50